MEQRESSPVDDLIAWRNRTKTFLSYERPGHDRDSHGRRVEIDIDDLIGANGRKLAPTSEELGFFNPPDADGVGAERPIDTPNQYALRTATEIPTCVQTDFTAEERAQNVRALLGPVGARNAEQLVGPLEEALDRLKNPVRVVAFRYLYFGLGTPEAAEDTARELGTSVETVAFLGDVALDLIGSYLTIR